MLSDWIESHCRIVEPMLATKAARQFLKDTNQEVSPSAINRVIVELHGLGLLMGKPNKPGTIARLTYE